MAKKRITYICVACGAELSGWAGRCTQCGEWNTVVEAEPASSKQHKAMKATSFTLADISSNDIVRLSSRYAEFDLVCGGGIVPGSVILIGGEPGIGKSTLSLQIADSFRTLYISGEESPTQIKQRAVRLGIRESSIILSNTTVTEEIAVLVEREKPQAVFIDSIQTISTSSHPGPSGSAAQLRESASQLTEIAKTSSIPFFLIGHITKEGAIAGPKILEHIVDTVLYFEGDANHEYRLLRSFKNRFGSVNEIGIFSMTDKGLVEVKDRNRVFLNPYETQSAGSAVCSAVEGTRTLLFEVQSLVNFTNFTNPRRMADGLDINRLLIIIAALEKHCELKLQSFDVFLNVAGGFQINETASDLAVAAAIVSSYSDIPIPLNSGFLGEISLSGDIRPVSHFERRVTEFSRNSFSQVFVPARNADEVTIKGCELIPVKTLGDVMKSIFTTNKKQSG